MAQVTSTARIGSSIAQDVRHGRRGRWVRRCGGADPASVCVAGFRHYGGGGAGRDGRRHVVVGHPGAGGGEARGIRAHMDHVIVYPASFGMTSERSGQVTADLLSAGAPAVSS
jgi:hypothetical protein